VIDTLSLVAVMTNGCRVALRSCPPGARRRKLKGSGWRGTKRLPFLSIFRGWRIPTGFSYAPTKLRRAGRRRVSEMRAMADPQDLRKLAAWYREFANRAGNPWIWEARVIMADDLERGAALLEARLIQTARPSSSRAA
jgi:hypothetical protein